MKICLRTLLKKNSKGAISQKNCLIHIDGHVRLIRLARLVRLQMDNYRLFLRQQMDNRQTSVCTMNKRLIDLGK